MEIKFQVVLISSWISDGDVVVGQYDTKEKAIKVIQVFVGGQYYIREVYLP